MTSASDALDSEAGSSSADWAQALVDGSIITSKKGTHTLRQPFIFALTLCTLLLIFVPA